MIVLFLETWILLLGTGVILWLVSLRLKDSSIIDPWWGLFYVMVSSYLYCHLNNPPLRSMLVFVFVSIWGLRLSGYLLWRNWGKGEDYRYQEMRERAGTGNFWWTSLFKVFLFQTTLAWLISSTLFAALTTKQPLNWLDALAILIWIIGMAFEAGGDWQLMRFKQSPANEGKLLTSGFWRYTRHPNYFGDAVCWWSYALFGLAAGQYYALVGAAVMTYLLMRVSGVRLLEEKLKTSKPGYEAYMQNTPAFFPRLKTRRK